MEQLNPFDDPAQVCRVRHNEQRQYSLWPDFSSVPAGWTSVFGPSPRAECVEWLESPWMDRRPANLVALRR
ncbi:MbtH family protein [Acerihabitans sp. TG2]|uniref:MbtH family protein n=1 Tax=Acerihabitans sp. TG2 TaxID=3096008 RepID=UPI002B22F134|nr:MbtH family protein [Acerihabitans sp. TG2]MEA9391501.1 MbtH family protein [Acerihabitans sp. TG2]